MPNWCAGTLRVRGKKKDSHLAFKDYIWECICPNVGG